MNKNTYPESDWQLFRLKYPEWRERYAQSRLEEYSHILGSDSPAVEKLFFIEDQIKSDMVSPAMKLPYRYCRSNILSNTVALIETNEITVEDISGFSELFKTHVGIYLKANEAI